MTVRPTSSHRARSSRLALSAATALLLYIALGAYVSPRPPGSVDLAAESLVGHGLGLALVAYRSGLFPTYATLAALALLASIWLPRWRGRVAFGVVALLVAWRISDLFKSVFARPRPEHWVLVRESSGSYSSGHATLSLVVYGLWAYFIWRSGLPRPVRVAVSGMLVLWCLIVAWSRLAMGAHFPTDLAGGWLLGLVVLTALGAATGFLRRKTL